MGHIAGSTFGIGTSGMQPWGLQPQLQPFSSQWPSGYAVGAAQPLPQLLQLLQILPQQLQQLQFLQQQHIAYLQQLLQLVPAQLQQIQQLIHAVPQQSQQLQQWQPLASGMSAPIGFGLAPQGLPGPAASHVM
jgi:hypothetical protein